MTISFHNDTQQFLGINTFGIRMRHEVFDRWLTENRDMDYVIEHLIDANFDPEFYKHHEAAIVAQYNAEFNKQVKSRKKSLKRIFVSS